MTIRNNPELQSLRESIIEGMLEYMGEAEVDYTKQHVAECKQILEDHLDALCTVQNRDAALECVKSTVLNLNQLNEQAGEDLIETEQREEICEYLIRAGAMLGFNGADEDVTYEWREW